MGLQGSLGNRATGALLGGGARAVLQRKPLVPGKLNVAGENHDDSKARREPERRYSTAYTNGGYWREGEFRAVVPFWEKLFSNPKLGDPLLLRAEFIVGQLKEKTLPLYLQPIANGEVPIDMQVGPLALAWEVVQEKLLKDIGQVRNAVDRALDDPGERDEAQRALQFKGQLETIIEDLKGDATAAAVLPSVQRAIKTFEDDVARREATQDQAMMARSVAMHKAAKSAHAAGLTGLWKVGDQHIEQMRTQQAVKYELLTKAEFNADFEHWQSVGEVKWHE
jgi:hypothetical protein